ncbi:MAG: hypothetical protein F4Y75_09725 [Acidimicrobiia bacterium]|nr:hypothetical protein [bacterium]MCY3652517.1 hypothetical protein [bacterium]MDE0643912.1 hypothetical protein [bacterium]MXZ07753.1 hypothetical protein [Acidimicrobiia bacterium]
MNSEPHPDSDLPPESQAAGEASLEPYIRAVEGLDATRSSVPLAALAELLEARLAGKDAPEARKILDELL